MCEIKNRLTVILQINSCRVCCVWTSLSKHQFLWDSWLYGRVVTSILRAVTPNVYFWSLCESVCLLCVCARVFGQLELVRRATTAYNEWAACGGRWWWWWKLWKPNLTLFVPFLFWCFYPNTDTFRSTTSDHLFNWLSCHKGHVVWDSWVNKCACKHARTHRHTQTHKVLSFHYLGEWITMELMMIMIIMTVYLSASVELCAGACEEKQIYTADISQGGEMHKKKEETKTKQ